MSIDEVAELNFAPSTTRMPGSSARHLSGFSVEHVRLPETPFEFRLSSERNYLAIHDIELADGEVTIGNQLRSQSRSIVDSLTFVPAGQEAFGWSKPARRHNSFTAIYFDTAVLTGDVLKSFSSKDRAPFLYKRNKPLEETVKKVQAALTHGMNSAYLESLLVCAVCELLEIPDLTVSGALSNRQLDTVTDYIQSHLAEDLSVDDMAKVAGLSRFHFSRQFKAVTSRSPYQFLLSKRIQKSEQLLRETSMSLTEIASSCGFNSASQFSEAFTRLVGIRPQAFRLGRS